jgi:hypothetical protein
VAKFEYEKDLYQQLNFIDVGESAHKTLLDFRH